MKSVVQHRFLHKFAFNMEAFKYSMNAESAETVQNSSTVEF